MKFKGSIFFSTLIAAFLLGAAYYPPKVNTEKEAILIQRMLSGLNQLHYQPQSIDNSFSEKVYDLYLDRIDGGRRWLTQEDLNMLQSYKNQIDDEANGGTYQFFNESVILLDAGIKKTQQYYRDILDQPFDFSKQEQFELDGDKKVFAKDDNQLKEYWRKALKYETMTKLAGKVKAKAEGDEKLAAMSEAELEADARKDVLKTFDDLYQRLYKLDRNDRLSDYLNAITSVFDPHTVYFEPKDKESFDIRMSGTLEGIGAQLQEDGNYTKVVRIIPGGPAWKQGELKANDLIVKVTQEDAE
ncbi:MAG: PDZ domain-containing protein, partial [Bacteroidota bacterium]